MTAAETPLTNAPGPTSIGIVGLGTIGGQCAHLLESAGLAPITVDRGDDLRLLAQCTFIIEAVPEAVALKREVLQAVHAVAPAAVLATTTSSLSLTDLSTALTDPSRLIAFHPFSPMNRLPLLEIGHGDQTSPVAISMARGVAHAMQRTTLEVPDGVGLVVNRLLKRWTHQGIREVEQGLEPDEVDRVFVDAGWPMGPLAVVAMVGPALSLSVSRNLAQAHGSRFAPPTLLERWAAQATPSPAPTPSEPAPQSPARGEGPQAALDGIMHRASHELRDERQRLIADGMIDPNTDVPDLLRAAAGWPVAASRSMFV